MRARGIAPLLALAASVLAASPAAPATELSTDITADLSGTVANDEDVVEDTGAGAPGKIPLGALPAASDVTGYSVAGNGDVLLSFETTTSLAGGVVASPRDVVRWNGTSYSIELRGEDVGVPAGARIDAIGVVAGGDLLLSFDIAVPLGGGVVAEDEDLVQLESTQPTAWSILFDGSAQGVPAGADLDGADVIDGTGRLALSFDVSGEVKGTSFDDEDVLGFDPAGGAWSMLYDGATRHPALVAADVDALFVPEPGAFALAAAAAAGMTLVAAGRRAIV